MQKVDFPNYALLYPDGVRLDSVRPGDADDARAAMIERNRNAWRSDSSATSDRRAADESPRELRLDDQEPDPAAAHAAMRQRNADAWRR